MKKFMKKLDDACAVVNVFLVVIAIGIGTLDLTFLVTNNIMKNMPQITRVVFVEGPNAPY